jgi:predicted DNA-binding transcriptional regulator AlpA
MTSPTRYYTTAQAAKLAGIGKNTLMEWLQKKYVPEPERDWRGWRRWTQADIDRVIAHKQAPRTAPVARPVARRTRVAEGVHS